MLALTYMEHERFALIQKPKPVLPDPRDAVVRVTLGSICTRHLHFENKLDGVIKIAVTPRKTWRWFL